MSEKKAIKILVTNDDSIMAPGLKVLVDVAKKIGKVIVVAPHDAQSGMGHAVTVNTHLRLTKTSIFGEDVISYTSTGTPVDCIKLGINKILNNVVPDLILSGVNHGSNASTNILYSGTMSAAVEGALENIPSIGFSFLNHSWDADIKEYQKYIEEIILTAVENKIPENTCLNVNIPDVKRKENISGIKICRQAKAYWADEFDERLDPLGHKYYWLTGKFENHDKGEDSDVFNLQKGYITIVPIQFDMTSYKNMPIINSWKFKSNE